MAVVASFTVSEQIITSGLTVSFTDTSTGSPTNWLWDFGDDTYSNEQHPEHAFNGNPNSIFNVKLKVWINSSTIPLTLSTISKETRGGANKSTIEAALADWQANSWTSTGSGGWQIRVIENSDGDAWSYAGLRRTERVVIPASPSGAGPSVYMLESRRGNVGWAINAGSLTTDLGGNMAASSDFSTWEAMVDITNFAGTTKDILFKPVESILPAPGPTNTAGISGTQRVNEYTTASADDFDSKIQLIVLAAGIVDFVGTPLIGTSPLEVQFTDLSTVDHVTSVWDFGDGNTLTVSGMTNPTNTYVSNPV